ncbi:partial transposase in ISPg1 [Tannerella forsythia 3313]|nr:partial transposase in ISPg1 [Tannerella forsythia 3313]
MRYICLHYLHISLIFSIFICINKSVNMATKQTESAPSFLQVYTQVRRDRMKHSFLRQINSSC